MPISGIAAGLAFPWFYSEMISGYGSLPVIELRRHGSWWIELPVALGPSCRGLVRLAGEADPLRGA
jgi:hypothetical protein